MRSTAGALMLAIVAAACGGGSSGARPSTPSGVTLSRLTVTSSAFRPNGAMPVDTTCDGADRSPPLTWSAVPPGTQSVVVLAEDPDGPGGDFTHWIAFGIPAGTSTLPEAADPGAVGGANGMNDFQRIGYSGPCPPKGDTHRYVFRVFALDTMVEAPSGATRAMVEKAMAGHVLAEGHLVGSYGR